MSVTPLVTGFAIGLGMIIPIGVQNAYVLNQGIKRHYHMTVAFICILCDALLLTFGVYGGAVLLTSHPTVAAIITWGGVLFLLYYGCSMIKQAIKYQPSKAQQQWNKKGRGVVIATTFAIALLNPHLYLETIMILGSLSGQYVGNEKLLFLVGTITASIVWFLTLAAGAAKMSPWLAKPNVERGINLFAGLMVLGIAFGLLYSVYGQLI
ncbi:LysE/ArgO family amino acid transporter [Thalassotalea fusca]